MKLLKLLLCTAVTCLFFTGCTSSNYVLDLKGAPVISNGNVVQEKIVYVADVTDNRMFVNNSEDLSIPNGLQLSKEYKSRAYATFTPV